MHEMQTSSESIRANRWACEMDGANSIVRENTSTATLTQKLITTISARKVAREMNFRGTFKHICKDCLKKCIDEKGIFKVDKKNEDVTYIVMCSHRGTSKNTHVDRIKGNKLQRLQFAGSDQSSQKHPTKQK